MKPTVQALSLSLVFLAAGCVSRSEYDATKQQLEGCERDKVAAQKSSSDCETRLDTESKRWDSIESQLTSTLPQTLKEFQDERTKIIQIVPEQVRNEVGKRLDRYFVTVSKQFERLDGKMEGLREELAASRSELKELSATTRSVDTKVDMTHKAVLTEQTARSDQHRRVSELVATIADFDSGRVNCDKCRERIKLKGKGKDQLLAFHAELIKKLQALQGTGATH